MNFNEYQAPIRDEKGLLCYYCSMETFYNIVSSKEFWINDMHSMNDPMENYMLSINYCNELKNLYKQNPFDFSFNINNKKINFDNYIDEINSNYEKFQNYKYSSFYFSLCFSKNIDDLNMWRMYGDNGKGVYIAIKKNSLKKYCNEQNKDKEVFFRENVIYKKELSDLKEIFSQNLFNKIKEIALKKDYNELIKFKDFDYVNWLKTECFKYKLGDFASEKEIRLVYKKDTTHFMCSKIDESTLEEMSDINIRYSNNRLIMYKNIPLYSLEIDSICIGPQNNCDKASLKLFLAKNEINCEKVFKSGIMYR